MKKNKHNKLKMFSDNKAKIIFISKFIILNHVRKNGNKPKIQLKTEQELEHKNHLDIKEILQRILIMLVHK